MSDLLHGRLNREPHTADIGTEVQRRALSADEARLFMAEIRNSSCITGYSFGEWDCPGFS